MAPKDPDRQAVIRDPILLWLLINGGDPPPPEVADALIGLLIHQLAARLGDEGLRDTIQGHVAPTIRAPRAALHESP